MTTTTLQHAIDLISRRTGLNARTLQSIDIATILHDLSNGNMSALVEHLESTHERESVWQSLLDALSIGESYFLRDKRHFELLKTHILPELVLAHRKANDLSLKVWSVGCSTGEEAYSLAVTLYEFLPDFERWDVEILGTDINEKSLQSAQAGVYRPWAFRMTQPRFQTQYFEDFGDSKILKPHIHNMVNFEQRNLVTFAPPRDDFDLIFCRHMLLYLHHQATEQVETVLYQSLKREGWLVLGQSEALRYYHTRWITHSFPGAPIYQRPSKRITQTLNALRLKNPKRDTKPLNNGHSEPRVAYQMAVNAVHIEDYETAEHLLLHLLNETPDHAKGHTLLGFIFASRRALNEAHAQVDLALKCEPLLPDGHYLKAMLYLEENMLIQAQKALQTTLYCERDHALATFTLGNLYAQSGNLPKAYSAWDNARRAIRFLDSEAYLSDLSDMTVANFEALLESHLEDA